jgi:putative flippase GtrA
VILRFLVVGAANTLFGLGVYWLVLYVGLSYQWAAASALVLGIIVSFNSHRWLVFRVPGRFVRYVLVWLFVYFVNITLISVIREYVGDYIAGVVLIPVNALLAYVLMKRFVFHRAKASSAEQP